ncbi:MAG: hypothetical protein R3F62_21975 [Planctomycetota bacterium]
MKKLVLVCAFAAAAAPLASAGLFGSSRAKKIRQQREKNQAFQEQVMQFFNVDAVPGYDADLTSMDSLSSQLGGTGAESAFGAATGDTSPILQMLMRARLSDGRNRALASRSAGSAIQQHKLSSVFGGEREGDHTSTTLPFLDTTDMEDLAYKLETVKVAEAALKELKSSGGGAAGGFKMMKFLNKLMKKVSSRQKNLVNSMLMLVSVPYFSTLASSWWMGPTTAMNITWPGAQQGIGSMIEQVLKKFGRIGMGMNIQDYASQLVSGQAGMDLSGGLGGLTGGGLGGLGQLNEGLGQAGLSLGDAGKSVGEITGKLGGNLGRELGQGLNVGEQLGLGSVEVAGFEVDLAEQVDRQVTKATQRAGQELGQRVGAGVELPDGLAQVNAGLGKVNGTLRNVGLDLGDAGKSTLQIAGEVGGYAGQRVANLSVGTARLGAVGDVLGSRIEREAAKLGADFAQGAVRAN